jgi:hypothetical protein
MLSILPASGHAQAKSPEFLKAVPDAPAFTFLAVTPTKIERPGNLRDLGVAILNGVGEDGSPRQGLAIDASVWNLIPGYDVPLSSYQSNPFSYIIGNLQASLGTALSAGDSADLHAAFGLKTVLVDRGDPLLSDSVIEEVAAGLRRCRDALSQPGMGEAAEACVDSVAERHILNFTSRRWNATQLAVAAAFGSRFRNGEIDRGEYAGMDGWLVGALPVGTKFQLLGQATYKHRTEFDTVPAYSAFNAGLRLIGGSSTFNVFGELAREWRSPDGGGSLIVDKEVGGWSAGIEFRVAANTWISTGIGTQFESLDQPNRTFVIANVKWGLSSQARIAKLQSQ